MSLLAEQIEQLRKEHYNATLVSLRRVHEELAIFRVRPDFEVHKHVPGQYTTLGLGHWESRCSDAPPEQLKPGAETRLVRREYSLSHQMVDEQGRLIPAGAPKELEFYIVHVRGGESDAVPALTPRLFQLKEGDRLFVGEKILGFYTLHQFQPTDAVIFLSTGTGEAPHNYMLWQLLSQGHRGPILATCCVRLKRDLAYLKQHETLMRQYPNYKYLPLTTRETGQSKKCYIQDLIVSGDLEQHLGQTLNAAATHVYLCGNPKMIGVPLVDRATKAKSYPQPVGCVELLEQRGFVADSKLLKIQGNVHFEEYW
jgi:ferredoxin--NADP+ reductase